MATARSVPAVALQSKDNVLLVANYAPAVGYAWWLMEHMWTLIAEYCASRGRRCFLAYPSDGPVPYSISRSGIEVFTCDLRPGSPQLRANLAGEIRRRGISIVYLVDQPYFSPSYRAYRRAGVRLIINHDHTPGDRPPVTGLRRMLKVLRNRLNSATCDAWLTVSPLMRERALNNILVPSDRIFVVQNGIPPPPLAANARMASRRTLGLPQDALAVVTVGRAHRYKRIDFVIRVANHLCNEMRMKGIVFVYFGDGPERIRLEQMAERLLPAGSFIFAGNRPNVRQLLPGFDIALHPSMGEGFSLAILEYMAAGLATLVPDIPSVRQAIADERSGFVFPDADVRAASALIIRLQENETLRRSVGAEAASVVMNEFPLARTDSDFEAVLQCVLD